MHRILVKILPLLIILALVPSAVQAQTAQVTCSQDYTVTAGDWLSKLADKFYGDIKMYPAIADATNAAGGKYAKISNPDSIEVGAVLCIPSNADAGTLMKAHGSTSTTTTTPTPATAAKGVQHVLLISVDGLHASDLASYVKANPNSALASLSQHGVTYSNAAAPKPSDSFPGLLALVTGGTPKTTGVYYDDSYDRKLLPPTAAKAGDAPGTEVLYDESVDKDMNSIDGGGGVDPANFPRDPVTKQPVYPHSFLRANTIFEVIQAAGKPTAWSDKHFAYELVNGPSGKGVDDLYTPEIGPSSGTTASITKTQAYDGLKVTAMLNEIDGKDHTGKKTTAVPAIFGMNFQSVSVGQKLNGNGYTDANGTFSAGLLSSMQLVDQSLGKMVDELKKQNLYDSTVIIITAKHGQTPIDPALLKLTDKNTITAGVDPKLIAQLTNDDVALIWLTDQSKTADVAAAIAKNKDAAGIQDIYTFATTSPAWPFDDPSKDSRTPDIIVQPVPGVVYAKPNSKLAEHGGFNPTDNHVALLVEYPGFASAEQNDAAVQTTQVAPTILKALGLDPTALTAVKAENTQILPGLSW